ncbi:MAG TPA: signal peptidase II [Polyangia bacterium]
MVVGSMRTTTARLSLLGLVTLLVGCDHGTKLVAKAELQGQGPHEVIRGVLDLRYRENTDVAFNLLRAIPEGIRAPILIIAGGLALLALAAVLVRRPPRSPMGRAALLLVAAGAAGNYLDRLFRGYVVDFVHVHHWPVFNIADVYVTAGAAILAVSTLRLREGSRAG